MKIYDKQGFGHEISINKGCPIEILENSLKLNFPKSTFDIEGAFVKLGGKLDGKSKGALQQLEKPENSGSGKNGTGKK